MSSEVSLSCTMHHRPRHGYFYAGIQYRLLPGTFFILQIQSNFICVNGSCDAAALLRVLALRRLETLRNFGRSNGQDECGYGRE
jgi:hypothetical protein